MKASITTQSLNTLTLAAILAIMLNTGVLAQPNPESNNIDPASFYRLEKFINSSEQAVKYYAPTDEITENSISEINDLEMQKAIQHLDQLALAIEDEIKYSAPAGEIQMIPTNNEQAMSLYEISNRPVKVEFNSTSKDSWLINAGYYKATRPTAWNKVKSMFVEKQPGKTYADHIGK